MRARRQRARVQPPRCADLRELAAQFYEDMLQTLELEDAPQARSSGFLDGEGQGRWLTDSIRRDEMEAPWADED